MQKQTHHSEQDPKFRPRRGAVMIEMALVLPLFVTLMLGIVEFSQSMMVSQLLTNAAREGGRRGGLPGSTNAEIADSVRGFLEQTTNVNPESIIVKISIEAAEGNGDPDDQVENATRRDEVSVRVEVPFVELSYLTPLFLGDTVLVGESVMRRE